MEMKTPNKAPDLTTYWYRKYKINKYCLWFWSFKMNPFSCNNVTYNHNDWLDSFLSSEEADQQVLLSVCSLYTPVFLFLKSPFFTIMTRSQLALI